MTVEELIEILQELAEGGFGKRDVHIGYQPNYPLESYLTGVVSPEDYDEDEDGDEGGSEDEDGSSDMEEVANENPVVLLTGESDVGYGNKSWWDNCQQ